MTGTGSRAIWIRLVVMLAVLFAIGSGHAASRPAIQAKVVGAQPALVGQQVSIEVTVIAPNFFLSAPPFPQLDVQGAVITMPDDRGVHGVQQQDGQTMAFIQKTYVFTAQQPGEFDLPPVKMEFSYQGEDGKPQRASLSLPPTRITAQLPAGAKGAASDVSVIPAVRLAVRQSVDRDVGRLAAGDTLVRTVEIDAPNTPAMLIPPPDFEAPSGVRLYKADPVLHDVNGQGGSFSGGQRIERVTYVFEKSGRYSLPAVTLKWLDPQTQTPATVQAPAVQVQVGGSVNAGDRIAPEFPIGTAAEPASKPIRWRLVAALAGALLLLLALGLLVHRRLPAWRRRRQAQQASHARSDAVMFEAVLAACRANDASGAHRALLMWSQVHTGGTPQAWSNEQGGGDLARQLDLLNRHLYRAAAQTAWSGSACASALEAAHRHWIERVPRVEGPFAAVRVLGPLNPFDSGSRDARISERNGTTKPAA
ncbi:hypothetical protein WKW79_34635 [Variovorax robiniae]|uniref:DUF7939 domain-containing protein n=1 Tax=Variovorax robiniae TaxID=1836199 RepID=A0ABU8XIL6_9BURK